MLKIRQQNQKIGKSPNLLNLNYQSGFFDKYHFKIVSFSKILIILIEVIFIGILAFSTTSSNEIIDAQEKALSLAYSVEQREEIQNETIKILNQTKQIKQIQQTKALLSSKTEYITTSVSNRNSKLNFATINNKEANIMVSVNSPIQFSLLLNDFINSSLLENIVLESARLDPNTGSFDIQIGLRFK